MWEEDGDEGAWEVGGGLASCRTSCSWDGAAASCCGGAAITVAVTPSPLL